MANKGVVNIQRLADGSQVLAPAERAIAFPAGWTIQDVPLGWLAGSAAGPEQVQGYLQLVPPPGQAPLPPPVMVPTVDATVTTLVTFPPVPAGGTMIFEAFVTPILGAGFANANIGGGSAPMAWSVQGTLNRVGSGGLALSNITPSGGQAPFVHGFVGGSTQGQILETSSGNSYVLQVKGFTTTEAWTTGHTYTAGDGATTAGQFVTNAGGVYLCTTSGTAGATAPTGMGTGISDGGATWAYICPVNGTQVPVKWWFQFTALMMVN